MDDDDMTVVIADLRLANSLERILEKLKRSHGQEITTVFEETLADEISWLRS